METVLITGGTGLVGTRLTELLQQKKYKVTHLSRSKKNENDVSTYTWDIKKETIEDEAITTANYIIHLAGAGIADKRWTTKRKKEIIDSRVKSANLLFEKTKTLQHPLKAFISASAVGYYGAITSEKIFTESEPPANDYIGETCRLWEAAADQFGQSSTVPGQTIRTVKVRTAVVLSAKGGILEKMMQPIRYYLGAPLGTGKQYMPWIHIDDLCRIYIKAVEDEKLQGAFNAVSPEHATNKEFTEAIANTLNKPLFLPNVPAWLLKIVLGEMGQVALKGSRVSCEKIQQAGFKFQFPDLKEALNNLLKN